MLPSAIRKTAAEDLLRWAIDADRAGFASLATMDRLVYDNYDSLATLGAVAAVTERARLVTSALLAPLWTDTALLAKQVAAVDRISGGRLVLGLAAGSRQDDFIASDVPMAGRGTHLETQIAETRASWAGELWLGGHSRRAIDRAARLADGWIAGSGGVGMFTHGASTFRAAWRAHNRTGTPKLAALTYFALGPTAAELADRHLSDYYAFAPSYAQIVLRNAAIGAARLRETLTRLENAGCDEVLLAPCTPDPSQLKELTSIVDI